MEEIWKFIRYWLYDRWFGGESVSAFDVRRAKLLTGPDIEIGNIKIPRWILAVILLVLVGFLLVVLIITLSKVSFTTVSQLADEDLVKTGECYARDNIDRNHIALDCLVGTTVRDYFFLVPALMLFVAGFVCGVLFEKRRGWR